MSLKLTATTIFAALAHVSLPTEKPGVFNEGSFTCRFNHLPHEEVNSFLDGLRDLGDGEQPARLTESLNYQHAFVKRALVAVEGIADDTGNLEPSAALELVLGNQTFWLAALKAFLETYNGAPAKNSKPSQKR